MCILGYFDNIKEQLDKQFISVKDSITFIFHQDNCTYQDAFNLVVKTLIFDQTHLLVMDGLKLKTIFICREKDPNSHNAYITIEALITQLEKPPSDSTAKDVSNVGFGKKRFYEQLLNMGFVFDNRLLFEAQSPDIDYSDCETEADGFAYYNGLPKEYEALKRSHDKLEQQLADEKAKDRFGMGTPKIEQGEPKDSEQIISELKDQITQLTNDNASLKNQLAQAHAELADAPANEQINDHTEKSYQTTIGLLLELMTTPKGIDDKAPFQSQATIIGDILDKDIQGQRKTTLENRFRDANLMLADAKKKRPKPN